MTAHFHPFYNHVLCLKLVPHTVSLVYSLDNNVMYLQDGRTPLFIASWKGHIAVVQLLLQMFADVSISRKVCHTVYCTDSSYSIFSFSIVCIINFNGLCRHVYYTCSPKDPVELMHFRKKRMARSLL